MWILPDAGAPAALHCLRQADGRAQLPNLNANSQKEYPS